LKYYGVTGIFDPRPNLQSKDITITDNGTTTIEPDTGYDGLNDVNVTINVKKRRPRLDANRI